jgi:hypothetical protein
MGKFQSSDGEGLRGRQAHPHLSKSCRDTWSRRKRRLLMRFETCTEIPAANAPRVTSTKSVHQNTLLRRCVHHAPTGGPFGCASGAYIIPLHLHHLSGHWIIPFPFFRSALLALTLSLPSSATVSKESQRGRPGSEASSFRAWCIVLSGHSSVMVLAGEMGGTTCRSFSPSPRQSRGRNSVTRSCPCTFGKNDDAKILV